MRRPDTWVGMMLRSAAILLLLSLSGCCTESVWALPRERSEVTSRVQANQVSLLETPVGLALFVELRGDKLPAQHFTLHPKPGREDAFRAACLGDPQRIRWMHIRHTESRKSSPSEWQAYVLARSTPDAPDVRVEMAISPAPTEGAAPVSSPLTLEGIDWTEVVDESHVGALGIAWRVAATPFAVAADLVLVIPIGLFLVYTAVTNPGQLTGG